MQFLKLKFSVGNIVLALILILCLQKCENKEKKIDQTLISSIINPLTENDEHEYRAYLFPENINQEELYKKIQSEYKYPFEKHNITTNDGYILTAWHFIDSSNNNNNFLNNNSNNNK